ncbi:MAG: NAD-binding protein [Deltaproteobacteria bacterium]|jgi:Trk K+ transport system NAD-binding subunit|nr:NAD-binding protein [Deltaproteobacteria bacterium]
MKQTISLLGAFLSNARNIRNMRLALRFVLVMLAVILAYSLIFRLVMLYEGRGGDYSLLTGLYWTLTVMTTLGFGDITFHTDLGKLFTLLVLFTGLILIVAMLPFMFVHLIYQPLAEAQRQTKVPTALPEGTRNHVLLVGVSDIAKTICKRLIQYQVPCYLLVSGQAEAEELYDKKYPVMRGELDMTDTYQAARIKDARMLAALNTDLKNVNIAATAHELAPELTLVSSAYSGNSINILRYAGCKEVYHFHKMLGAAIGRRVFAGRPETNIIARFEELCIAEVPAASTTLVGKKLMDLDLRSKLSLNIVGIWHGTAFQSTTPATVIEPKAVLLLAGTYDSLLKFDKTRINRELAGHTHPVLILGGGQVGQELIASLEKRGVPFRLIDKNPDVVKRDDPRYILGDAEDIAVLREAGIETLDSIAVTTHNDDLNIYLTLYCRKLRPDAQIITRCNLNRNIKSLYNAGADLVISAPTMAANIFINLISPDTVHTLTEGMNIFRVAMPPDLVGKNLRNSGIRNSTRCNVAAMRRDGKMVVSMDPDAKFQEGDELIMIGSTEDEQAFNTAFPPRQPAPAEAAAHA